MLRHWSQFVPNVSTDIRGLEALHQNQMWGLINVLISDVGLTYQGQIKSERDLCPPINTHPDGVTGNKGPWLQEAWRVDSTLIWSSFLPLVPPTPTPHPAPSITNVIIQPAQAPNDLQWGRGYGVSCQSGW